MSAAFLTRDLLGRVAVRGVVGGACAALLGWTFVSPVAAFLAGSVLALLTLLAGWPPLARRPYLLGTALSVTAVGWAILVVVHAGAQRSPWQEQGLSAAFEGARLALWALLDVDGLRPFSRSVGAMRWLVLVHGAGVAALSVALRDRPRDDDALARSLAPWIGIALCGYAGFVVRVLLYDGPSYSGTPLHGATLGSALWTLAPTLLVFAFLYPLVLALSYPLSGLLALADRLAQALGVTGPRPEPED